MRLPFIKDNKKRPQPRAQAYPRPTPGTTKSPSLVRRQIIVGASLAIVIALILTAVYYTTRIESMQIDKVEVIGGRTIPHSTIEKITNDTLSGTYLKLIPRRFTLTYPQATITANLVALDRVNHVQVERDGTKLLVVFDEYVPYALWCDTDPESDCYFIDKSGYAFSLAPELSGGAFVRFVDSIRSPERRTEAFPADFIRDNDEFINSLETKLGLFVTEVDKLGDYDLEYEVSGGGRLKVSQTIPLTTTFKNLQAILSSEEFVHLEPGTFKYIDLRFGDKVFVNEQLEESVASSTDEVGE